IEIEGETQRILRSRTVEADETGQPVLRQRFGRRAQDPAQVGVLEARHALQLALAFLELRFQLCAGDASLDVPHAEVVRREDGVEFEVAQLETVDDTLHGTTQLGRRRRPAEVQIALQAAAPLDRRYEARHLAQVQRLELELAARQRRARHDAQRALE